jgi:beta-phosphoglucomutase family hydrolase
MIPDSTMLVPGLALVFDMDGVIVDSMPVHTRAWEIYLERLGIQCEDLEARMHGRRNDEIVADFIGAHLAPGVIHGHGAAKEELYRELIRPELEARLVPGVLEFLHKDAGDLLAVASNAEPANVEFVLEGVQIRRLFKAIVDGMQVKNPKPHPDVYLRAAGELGVVPKNCIVFEDSPAGVLAARRAGARVVGVETHSPLEDVDTRISNFLDPGLERWLCEQSPA